MKLKKQFTLLITVAVAIPLIFLFFLLIENYMHSTNRFLIEGYKEIEEIEKKDVTEYQDALDIISEIPPEVQYCLVDTETNTVVFSSIPEVEKIDSMKALWDIVSRSTNKYFYQFTSPETKRETILITRIARQKQDLSSPLKIIYSLVVVFSITLIISICFIVYISRTIFRSIMIINNETKEIANGNINEPIKCKEKRVDNNEITNILESLEKMRLSLCENEKRKSNFIMGISHDLRTPIAIMKGYMEAISDGVIDNPNDIRDALGLVQTKIEQLEAMINELINFTKLNNFELREHLTLNSITDIIRTFAKESQLSADVFKKIVVTKVDLPDEDIMIPLNKQLILRAFENLFSNALRYTKDGDVITISSYIQDGDEIVVSVQDTGVGINEKDLPHIFDLFYKTSSSRQGQSMGIGLAVVKNVLDAHGWAIDVESEKNKGTKFTIYIPFKQNNKA